MSDLVDNIPTTNVLAKASLAGQVVWSVNADPRENFGGCHVRSGYVWLDRRLHGNFADKWLRSGLGCVYLDLAQA